jgi:hypothetical protein
MGSTRYEDIPLARAEGDRKGEATFYTFGRNLDIDVGIPEDIWGGGGVYTGFPDVAETMEVFSSVGSDNSTGTGARTVEISNLLDITGAEMPPITVVLNGTTPVSLGAQTYWRASRMKILTAGSNQENNGKITLRHTSTTSNVFAVMPEGNNQTAIACFTVPLGHVLYINYTDLTMARSNGSPGSADMTIRTRPLGGVFNAIRTPAITQGQSYTYDADDYTKLEALTDYKVRCETVSDNNTIISAEIKGVLITI